MSRFTPVKFEMPKNAEKTSKSKTINFNDELLKAVADSIRSDFEDIKVGESDLTSYAINPGSFGFPADNRLKILLTNPNEKNLKGFLEIAKQDFGVAAHEKWKRLLLATVVMEETTDE